MYKASVRSRQFHYMLCQMEVCRMRLPVTAIVSRTLVRTSDPIGMYMVHLSE